MATVDFLEYYPGIGFAWQRAVSLWSTWLQAGNPNSAISVGTNGGCRMIQISQVVGADTNRYNLIAMDIPGTNVLVPLPHIMNAPGFFSTPPILLSVYGATTTRTSWVNNLINVRANVWGAFMGVTNPVYTTTDYTDAVTGLRLVHSVATVRKLGCVAVDAMLLGVTDGTLPARTTIATSPTDGKLSSGPGASSVVDNTALVSALEDIAMRDVDYSINNGGVVFSMRGKVNVS